jgi:hypothetical protein
MGCSPYTRRADSPLFEARTGVGGGPSSGEALFMREAGRGSRTNAERGVTTRSDFTSPRAAPIFRERMARSNGPALNLCWFIS